MIANGFPFVELIVEPTEEAVLAMRSILRGRHYIPAIDGDPQKGEFAWALCRDMPRITRSIQERCFRCKEQGKSGREVTADHRVFLWRFTEFDEENAREWLKRSKRLRLADYVESPELIVERIDAEIEDADGNFVEMPG